MAYGDSGSGNGLSNKSVTFKGFSSRADKQNFKLYDFEVAKQDLINRLSIRKGERVENPELTAEEVQLIKEELSKQPTVKAVADELSKIVKLDDKIELPKVDLDGINSKANTIQNLIDNPKQTAINFVSGLVQSYEGRAIVRHNLRKIGKFFGLGGGGRDKDDIA